MRNAGSQWRVYREQIPKSTVVGIEFRSAVPERGGVRIGEGVADPVFQFAKIWASPVMIEVCE